MDHDTGDEVIAELVPEPYQGLRPDEKQAGELGEQLVEKRTQSSGRYRTKPRRLAAARAKRGGEGGI